MPRWKELWSLVPMTFLTRILNGDDDDGGDARARNRDPYLRVHDLSGGRTFSWLGAEVPAPAENVLVTTSLNGNDDDDGNRYLRKVELI